MVYLNPTSGRTFDVLPGLVVCSALSASAIFLGSWLAIPAVLTAIILGMIVRPLAVKLGRWEGIDFSAKTLLRVAIVLIGFRLSISEIAAIGLPAIIVGGAAVVLMLSAGYGVARLLGLDASRSFLSAGSVGICGASAALAISTILPQSADRDEETVYTICAVTVLSTIAMVLYPIFVQFGELNAMQAGVFLGSSIHDLTQVIGASALVSPQAIEAATLTKLVRVASLAPAVVVIAFALSQRSGFEQSDEALSRSSAYTVGLPWFIYGFGLTAAVASSGLIPREGIFLSTQATTFLLVTATVALGMKTDLRSIVADGWRPAAVMLLQTALLAIAAFGTVILFIP